MELQMLNMVLALVNLALQSCILVSVIQLTTIGKPKGRRTIKVYCPRCNRPHYIGYRFIRPKEHNCHYCGEIMECKGAERIF